MLRDQTGQSLIETIVAIFVLTTALTTGLGLAIYSFTTTSLSQNEIIASNLAREGVEVVRAMRDSNWLAGDVKGGNWDLTSCPDIGGKFCYPRAYQQVPPYNHYDLNSGNQHPTFDASSASWSLDNQPKYDLYLQPDGTYTDNSNGTSVFGRMINITFNTNSPYTNQNSNQEMIVKSIVAWRGKNCATFSTNTDLLALATSCKIVVEEHMTNWKDYK